MIGRTLRQYVITGRLGQGGMGEVWLARDSTLERDVALKVLPAGDTDAVLRKERFIREARAASALNHPNIITIYEINSDQGIDFIAMEYVEGRTLSGLLQQGTMTVDSVQRYATQIAEAVGRAHRAGIVHRDLKPGNIMVTNDGLVKVLDFGLAKVSHPPDASAATDMATQMALTRAGTTVGTLGYMSPEQAIGDHVDARSDVFAFGVILYEMLAGRLPFAGQTLSDVLHQLHFSEPPPIESLRPDAPLSLRTIAGRALAKKPESRFLNLSEVAIALADGAPANAATGAIPSPEAPIAPSRRHRQWLAVAALVAVAIAGIAAAATWPWRAAESADNPPAPPAVGEPAGAYELTRSAAALLSRSDRDGNADRAIAQLERVLAMDPNSAIAYVHLASGYLRKQQSNPDPQWMKLARENAQRAISLTADLAAGHTALGFVHLEAGEHPAAAAALRRAAELDPVNAFPQIGLAMNFAAQSQDAEAETAFRKAIQLGPQEWRSHGELAQFYFRRGRYAEASTHWDTALELTPDNVLVLRNLGAVYYLLGRHDEAASILQRALEVRPIASTYTNLGTIRFFQGRYTDAVVAFEKAVDLGANNHNFWGNLGDGYRWAPGRRGDAAAAYRRAMALIEQQIAKKPGDSDLESRHAIYLVKSGNVAAALTTIEGVVVRPNLTPQIRFRSAVVFELAGVRDRALTSLRRALEAGYAVADVASDPELTALRADARYHRLLDSVAVKPAAP